MDLGEVYPSLIPDIIQEVQEHIRTRRDFMDKVERQRKATKSKLEVLRKKGPSLQK